MLGVASLLPVLGAVTNPGEYRGRNSSPAVVVGVGLGFGAIFMRSSSVGLDRISACDRAHAEAATAPSLRVIKRSFPALPPGPAADADAGAPVGQ